MEIRTVYLEQVEGVAGAVWFVQPRMDEHLDCFAGASNESHAECTASWQLIIPDAHSGSNDMNMLVLCRIPKMSVEGLSNPPGHNSCILLSWPVQSANGLFVCLVVLLFIDEYVIYAIPGSVGPIRRYPQLVSHDD